MLRSDAPHAGPAPEHPCPLRLGEQGVCARGPHPPGVGAPPPRAVVGGQAHRSRSGGQDEPARHARRRLVLQVHLLVRTAVGPGLLAGEPVQRGRFPAGPLGRRKEHRGARHQLVERLEGPGGGGVRFGVPERAPPHHLTGVRRAADEVDGDCPAVLVAEQALARGLREVAPRLEAGACPQHLARPSEDRLSAAAEDQVAGRDPGGDAGHEAARRGRRIVKVRRDIPEGVRGVERQPSGEQFEQHAPEGVQVAALLGAPACLLRRHVRGRAHHEPGVGQPVAGSRGVGGAGDPEVEHLQDARGRDEQIRGLGVAVEDPSGMRLTQGVTHLRPPTAPPPPRRPVRAGQRRPGPRPGAVPSRGTASCPRRWPAARRPGGHGARQSVSPSPDPRRCPSSPRGCRGGRRGRR